MKRRPKYVSHYRDRHGVLRWRYREPGKPQSQTRATFGSPEWLRWYDDAQAARPKPIGADRTKPGTVHALCVSYYASARFKTKAKTTQTTYRGIIERWRVKAGDAPVSALRKDDILKSMDIRSETPGAANNFLKVMRDVMAHAVERRLIKASPTDGIKMLRYRSDGFHTWTEAEIARFEAKWPPETKQRLAFALLLYTAQRSSDVRMIGPGNRASYDGKPFLSVRQQKTGVELDIPVHAKLAAILDLHPTNARTFIATQAGDPYTAAGFGNWMRDAIKDAGLPKGVTPHGLRKAASRRLAESGASANQIMAITGHTTLKEVSRYTKAAQQKGLASDAMERI